MVEVAGDGHTAVAEYQSIIFRLTPCASLAVLTSRPHHPHSANARSLWREPRQSFSACVVCIGSATCVSKPSFADALSDGRCLTGYRKCGTGEDERCISADEPCLTDVPQCPDGRSLCGDECVPEKYLTQGYKKECGGKCIWGQNVCEDGGEQCQAEWWTNCGDRCVKNKHYNSYGYRECDGKCISGNEECCSTNPVTTMVTTTTKTSPSTPDCCAEGYFTCGKECRFYSKIKIGFGSF